MSGGTYRLLVAKAIHVRTLLRLKQYEVPKIMQISELKLHFPQKKSLVLSEYSKTNKELLQLAYRTLCKSRPNHSAAMLIAYNNVETVPVQHCGNQIEFMQELKFLGSTPAYIACDFDDVYYKTDKSSCKTYENMRFNEFALHFHIYRPIIKSTEAIQRELKRLEKFARDTKDHKISKTHYEKWTEELSEYIQFLRFAAQSGIICEVDEVSKNPTNNHI